MTLADRIRDAALHTGPGDLEAIAAEVEALERDLAQAVHGLLHAADMLGRVRALIQDTSRHHVGVATWGGTDEPVRLVTVTALIDALGGDAHDDDRPRRAR